MHGGASRIFGSRIAREGKKICQWELPAMKGAFTQECGNAADHLRA
jgi:hypothetical protein